jgi:ABC-type nickel/cobalt efflux system permease component RcnA
MEIILIIIVVIIVGFFICYKMQSTDFIKESNENETVKLLSLSKKTNDEDEMVQVLKMLSIGNGTDEKDIDENELRLAWRRWGNGPHWDFPQDCKHKNKNDGIACTCGHPHDFDME